MRANTGLNLRPIDLGPARGGYSAWMLLPAALTLAVLTLATPSASPQDSRPVDDTGRKTFELFVEALRPTGSFDGLSVSAQANHTLSYTYASDQDARSFLLRNPTSPEWKARFIEAAHIAGPSAAVLQAHVAPIALFSQLLEQTAPARETAERFCVSRGYDSIEALRQELEGTFLPGVTLLLEKNTFDAQAADAPENDGTEVAAWTLLFTTKETFGKNKALKLFRTRLMHYYALKNTKAKKPVGVFSLREGPMTIVEFQERKIRGTGHLAMTQVGNTLFVSNSTSVLRKQMRRSLRHGKGKQNPPTRSTMFLRWLRSSPRLPKWRASSSGST